jgi:predicted  nucleic acid-binding Zn-ribbon protein
MPVITFKMSDGQKYDFLWSLLNVNYNEENGWIIEYGICDVYDDYAIVRNYAESIFERVYYTKNDETDSLEITKKEQCFMIDVNENEKKSLEALRAINENTYEAIDEKFTSLSNNLEAANNTIAERDNTISTMTEEISGYSTKIEELGNNITTLTQERDDAIALNTTNAERIVTVEGELSTVQSTLATVTQERDTLVTYKKNIEDNEKKTLIAEYAGRLPEDVIDTYTQNMDQYSIEDLDVKLTYELKKANPDIFGKGTPPAYIPKDNGPQGGLNAILAKYKK